MAGNNDDTTNDDLIAHLVAEDEQAEYMAGDTLDDKALACYLVGREEEEDGMKDSGGEDVDSLEALAQLAIASDYAVVVEQSTLMMARTKRKRSHRWCH